MARWMDGDDNDNNDNHGNNIPVVSGRFDFASHPGIEPVKIFGQIKFVKFENYPLNDVGGEWSVAERGSHIVGAARRALMLPPDVFHSTLSAFQVRLTCGICACCKTRKRIGKSLFSLPFSF